MAGGGAIHEAAVGEDVTGDNREGAEVRYFNTVDAGVDFFAELLQQQIDQEATIRAVIDKGGDEGRFLRNGTLYRDDTIAG